MATSTSTMELLLQQMTALVQARQQQITGQQVKIKLLAEHLATIPIRVLLRLQQTSKYFQNALIRLRTIRVRVSRLRIASNVTK